MAAVDRKARVIKEAESWSATDSFPCVLGFNLARGFFCLAYLILPRVFFVRGDIKALFQANLGASVVVRS